MLTEKDLTGRLKGFPLIVAIAALRNTMLRHPECTYAECLQYLQRAGPNGSFSWEKTVEGKDVWFSVHFKGFKEYFTSANKLWKNKI